MIRLLVVIIAVIAEGVAARDDAGLLQLHSRGSLLHVTLHEPATPTRLADFVRDVKTTLHIHRVVDSMSQLAPGMRDFLEEHAEAAEVRVWSLDPGSAAARWAGSEAPLNHQLIVGFDGTDAHQDVARLLALAPRDVDSKLHAVEVSELRDTSPADTPVPGDGWFTPVPSSTRIPLNVNIEFVAEFVPGHEDRHAFTAALEALFNLTSNETSELQLANVKTLTGSRLQWNFAGPQRFVFAHQVYDMTPWELRRDLWILELNCTALYPPPVNYNHAKRLPILLAGVAVALVGVGISVYFALRRKRRSDGFDEFTDDASTCPCSLCCCRAPRDGDESMAGIQDYSGGAERSAYAQLK